MRVSFIFACLLALICITSASDVCSGYSHPLAEISKPKTSKMALFLRPLRGVIDFFLDRSASGTSAEIDHLPWTIVTYPAYAQQVDDGWIVNIHGNLHKRQNQPKEKLNGLVNRILLKTRLEKIRWKFWQSHFHLLSDEEAKRARHLMREIASIPVKEGIIGVSFDTCNTTGLLPIKTNVEGSFYGTLKLPDECISPSSNNSDTAIPTSKFTLTACNLPTPADKENPNHDDVFFVPPKGVTIVADLDDVLRVANIWNWKQALLNIFARPLQPWRDMPKVIQSLKDRIEAQGQNVHFHYLTDAPELISGAYLANAKSYYPPGSWDFRPLNMTKTKEMFDTRHWNTKRLLESFPERKFIFMGDTTSSSMMKKWPITVKEHPKQVQCLLMRDTQATEKSDWVTPDSRQFIDMSPKNYLFYRIPADLYRLSGKHLAWLSPLDTYSNQTVGCFDVKHKLRQSLLPSHSRFTKIKSLAKATWWKVQCSWPFSFKRPSSGCPFDRIAGTKYADGKVEREIELDPYTDHLPTDE
jgi:phosphatidate phosphatase APP1